MQCEQEETKKMKSIVATREKQETSTQMYDVPSPMLLSFMVDDDLVATKPPDSSLPDEMTPCGLPTPKKLKLAPKTPIGMPFAMPFVLQQQQMMLQQQFFMQQALGQFLQLQYCCVKFEEYQVSNRGNHHRRRPPHDPYCIQHHMQS